MTMIKAISNMRQNKIIVHLFVILFAVCVSLVAAPQAHAHVGLQPFLLVNGKYANTYPVYSASISDFNLPQDVSVDNYTVGENIEFSLDLKALPPIPYDIRDKIKFIWDFKDGTPKVSGTKVQHTFKKMGSYVVDLKTDDGTGPSDLDLVLVNILPDLGYKLPQSIIKIENQTPKDPVTDVLYLQYGKSLTFDGSGSQAGSGKIKSYYWDLGDQTTSTNAKTTHAYKSDLGIMFPLLRVTDQNGFFSDSYVQISNKALQQSGAISSSPIPTHTKGGTMAKSQLGITLPVLFFYTAIAFVLRSVLSKKPN